MTYVIVTEDADGGQYVPMYSGVYGPYESVEDCRDALIADGWAKPKEKGDYWAYWSKTGMPLLYASIDELTPLGETGWPDV